MDTSPVVLAMCGLGLVCLGVLGIGMFMLLRATGSTFLAPILGVLGGLLGGAQSMRDEPDDSPLPLRSARPASASDNFQAKAQSLDFDSAVQRHRQQSQPPGAPVYPAQNVPPTFPAQNAPPTYPAQNAPPAYPPQNTAPMYTAQNVPPTTTPPNAQPPRPPAFPLQNPAFKPQNPTQSPPQNPPLTPLRPSSGQPPARPVSSPPPLSNTQPPPPLSGRPLPPPALGNTQVPPLRSPRRRVDEDDEVDLDDDLLG